MNMRGNAGRRLGEAAAGANQDPSQAPTTGVQVPVDPFGLTDGEVREAFLHMEHSITTQDKDITTQDTREGAPWENPHASTMGSSLRDFTKINSPV
ncbi:hypothetical protein EJD97_014832 [Solanum chilense]|uniref:Uncharacterized protein n=1 Tax=Solanum chilense TaxID=4083 RepID=A0A6N2BAI1_SOLCI|nr:hypothetical protein EJD97_014832 [Solanum chilense]